MSRPDGHAPAPSTMTTPPHRRYRTPWPLLRHGPVYDPALAGDAAARLADRLVEMALASWDDRGQAFELARGIGPRVSVPLVTLWPCDTRRRPELRARARARLVEALTCALRGR